MDPMKINNTSSTAAERSKENSSSSTSNNNDNDDISKDPQSLLTIKAYQTSLSAPRIPPYGSIQYELLLHGSKLRKLNAFTSRIRNNESCWVHHCHYSIHHPISIKEHDFLDEQYGTILKGTESASMDAHNTNITDQQLNKILLQHLLRTTGNDKSRRYKKIYKSHPYLLRNSTDPWGRYIAQNWISKHTTNQQRDIGFFRTLADNAVLMSLPFYAVSHPIAVKRFLQVSTPSRYETIQYGTTASSKSEQYYQKMDIFWPTEVTKMQRVIFFVHGGAWGSGLRWFYHLIAHPFLHPPERNKTTSTTNSDYYGIVVIGYRTYPDGVVQDQVDDIESAAKALHKRLQSIGKENCPVTIMGHSSGAHIALLALVDRAKQTIDYIRSNNYQIGNNSPIQKTIQFDSYIGLSGPYDISHHFDYESSRGVEELSPMKPVNGHTRTNFNYNSPATRFAYAVAGREPSGNNNSKSNNDSSATALSVDDESQIVNYLIRKQTTLFPRYMVFVHGIEDDTVPFTATAEVVQRFRSFHSTTGSSIQEIYVAHTGHQDCIMQMMLGGPTQSIVLNWLKEYVLPSQQQQQRSTIRPAEEQQSSHPTVVQIPSRL